MITHEHDVAAQRADPRRDGIVRRRIVRRCRPRGRDAATCRDGVDELREALRMAVQGVLGEPAALAADDARHPDRRRRGDHPRRRRPRLGRRGAEADRGPRHEHPHGRRPVRRRLRPRRRGGARELVSRTLHDRRTSRRSRTRAPRPTSSRCRRSSTAAVTATYGAATYRPASSSARRRPTRRRARTRSQAGTLHHRQDEAQHARVVVIGQTVVTNLFGTQDPIGQTVSSTARLPRSSACSSRRARTASRTRTTS